MRQAWRLLMSTRKSTNLTSNFFFELLYNRCLNSFRLPYTLLIYVICIWSINLSQKTLFYPTNTLNARHFYKLPFTLLTVFLTDLHTKVTLKMSSRQQVFETAFIQISASMCPCQDVLRFLRSSVLLLPERNKSKLNFQM